MKKTLLFSLIILTLSCNSKKEENNKNNYLIKLNQDSLALTNDTDSINVNLKDFREYSFPNRFSISFPNNWNVKEIEPNKQNQLHGFTILAEYGSRNISISEISRMFRNRNNMNSIFEIDFNDFIKPIPDLFDNYKLVYSVKTKLCNYDAYKLKISYDTKSIIDGSKINSYNIFYDILEPNSKNIYSICYTSTEPSNDDFETTFHYIVKTFKLLNSAVNNNSQSVNNHSQPVNKVTSISESKTENISYLSFVHLVKSNYKDIDSYLITRKWEIIQDDRKNGKGVVFFKQDGNYFEKIVYYRAAIIYSTNKSQFFSIVSDIKNNCDFFKSTIDDEDGTENNLYQNDICRFRYNVSRKEIMLSAQN
ncbi:MAG: hypothetical protein ACYC25_10640 [Paludibacter sp.]